MRIGFPGTGRVVRHPWTEFAWPEHEILADPDTMDKDTAELTAFHHPYACTAVKGVTY
jgi:hypothetical protein